MWWLTILPFLAQGVAIFFDETVFHLKRGLPKWERLGHPLDTLTVLACIAFILWIPFSTTTLILYIFLALFSTLFVTKDEFVHNEHCCAKEQWLHALLFILHPITLATLGFIWPVIQSNHTENWLLDNPSALRLFLYGQLTLMSLFFLYQIVFWNFIWRPSRDQQ